VKVVRVQDLLAVEADEGVRVNPLEHEVGGRRCAAAAAAQFGGRLKFTLVLPRVLGHPAHGQLVVPVEWVADDPGRLQRVERVVGEQHVRVGQGSVLVLQAPTFV